MTSKDLTSKDLTSKKIVLLPGDGIGGEVIDATRQVLEELACDQLSFDQASLGWGTFQETGDSLPPETLEKVRNSDGALLGAVSSPSHRVEGYRSPVLRLRRELDLYANLRPLQSSDGRIDMLVVRENTEGLYAGRERFEGSDTAVTERVITRDASRRIAEVAFDRARARSKPPQPKVTVVHKANVLRKSDGLFREVALDVGSGYPEIQVEEQLVDSMAYRMVLEPEHFDVILAPNLYGDILSDLGAALTGGLGLAPSANLGVRFCMAEPVHGSAPDIAGHGIANPIATLRAATLLLDELGLEEPAHRLSGAIARVLEEGPKTPDLGGSATTVEVTRAIVEAANTEA